MPTKKAVALNYKKDQGSGAPKVVAVGEGYIADKILLLAKENNVPVVENVELVSKLVKYVPGTEIPPELFEAVAKILAFIYNLEKKSEIV